MSMCMCGAARRRGVRAGGRAIDLVGDKVGLAGSRARARAAPHAELLRAVLHGVHPLVRLLARAEEDHAPLLVVVALRVPLRLADVVVCAAAWWLKVENRQHWASLRRDPEP